MSDKPTLFEKLRGKRTRNIELDNESGEVDKRIPNVGEAFTKAAKNFKAIQRGEVFKSLGPSKEAKKKNGLQ